MEVTIVVPRQSPDLDGVACAVGYAQFLSQVIGNSARAWVSGIPDAEARYHLRRFNPVCFAAEADVLKANSFVLVDASALPGLPSLVKPLRVVEVIDHRHHTSPKQAFPNATVQIEPVGAAATLIVERFVAASAFLRSDISAMLYGAIQSNTQLLRGSITTKRDIAAVEWLTRSASIPSDLIEEQLLARRTDIINDFRAALLNESKTFTLEDSQLCISQLEFTGAADYSRHNNAQIRTHIAQLRLPTILNMVDVQVPSSTILVSNDHLVHLLTRLLGLSFQCRVATAFPAILRKQILDVLLRQTDTNHDKAKDYI
jgi:manganese-dependent inorganic pyrophosphatase